VGGCGHVGLPLGLAFADRGLQVERVDKDEVACQQISRDFNLLTAETTTVLELAERIWRRINGDEPFRYVSDEPFEHDVQRRVPAKATALLGFDAATTHDEMLDEVVPWVVDAIERGLI
jgi:nucleoside-diphosphate-sugar epimerase